MSFLTRTHDFKYKALRPNHVDYHTKPKYLVTFKSVVGQDASIFSCFQRGRHLEYIIGSHTYTCEQLFPWIPLLLASNQAKTFGCYRTSCHTQLNQPCFNSILGSPVHALIPLLLVGHENPVVVISFAFSSR